MRHSTSILKHSKEYDVVITVTNDVVYDQRVIKVASSMVKFGKKVLVVGRQKDRKVDTAIDHFDAVLLLCRWNVGPLFYLEYNIRLLLLLRKLDFRTHYAVDLDTMLAGFFSKKFLKKRLVFDAHELFEQTPELSQSPFKRYIWKKLGDLAVPKADLAFTVNDSLRNILSKKYGIEFCTIRNVPFLVTPSREQSTDALGYADDGRKIILYQGAVNMGRGLEQAIEAMTRLDESFLLVIVGGGDIANRLRHRIRALDLQDQVHMLGMMSPDQLRVFTPNAWVGINLLDSTSANYYYSLANRFFDYMHAGVPSIHMKFPEYERILTEYPCGLMMEELSVDALVEVIKHLSEDANLYAQLKECALEASSHFNWELEERTLCAHM